MTPPRWVIITGVLALATFGVVQARAGGQGDSWRIAQHPGHPADSGVQCSTEPERGSEDDATATAWRLLKEQAFATLGLADEWTDPQRLPGAVNTLGWEDSAFIAPSGTTLYFMYVPYDMLSFVMQTGFDPARIDAYLRGPSRGVSPSSSSDSFRSASAGAAFCRPERFSYSQDGAHEFGLMETDQGEWYYVGMDATGQMDLYVNGSALPAPVRTPHNEDNPHVLASRYGRELFFDSDNRPGGIGGGDVWFAVEEGGRWTTPVPLSQPVNLPGSREAQPFLTSEGELYFTSSRSDWAAIWMSQRQDRNIWGSPKRVLWPASSADSGLLGVGEPTLTADGQWLYFVVIFRNDRGEHDADIARVRRAG